MTTLQTLFIAGESQRPQKAPDDSDESEYFPDLDHVDETIEEHEDTEITQEEIESLKSNCK